MKRCSIMIHQKGTSYENDYWLRDNKHFQIREFSYETAEAVLKILKHQYGDGIHFVLELLNDEKVERIFKNGYLPSEWLSEH